MIRRLILKNFRNYKELDLPLGASLNVLAGDNGQGKTNLLEALFFCSMLRSFRTSQVRDLRGIGGGGFYVSAECHNGRWPKTLEVDYQRQRQLRIDNVPVHKASAFIREIRAVAFSPDDIAIVSGNSSNRRRFADMFISIMEPAYMSSLHSYGTALKHRNAVLKSHRNDASLAMAYEPVMAEHAVNISRHREAYLQMLDAEMKRLLNELRGEHSAFDIRYRAEVPGDIDDVMRRFEAERKKDMLRGFTGSGPQTEDFELFLDRKAMRSYASAGQSRLIALCLKMATVNLLAASPGQHGNNIVALVDDVTGELDDNNRKAFFKVIGRAGQSFFTFTAPPADDYFADAELFRVSNGHIVREA